MPRAGWRAGSPLLRHPALHATFDAVSPCETDVQAMRPTCRISPTWLDMVRSRPRRRAYGTSSTSPCCYRRRSASASRSVYFRRCWRSMSRRTASMRSGTVFWTRRSQWRGSSRVRSYRGSSRASGISTASSSARPYRPSRPGCSRRSGTSGSGRRCVLRWALGWACNGSRAKPG